MDTSFLDPLRDLYHEYQMYKTHPGRKGHLKNLQKNFRNQGVSIIANNCMAGLIYHDLKQPFLTPIVNCRFAPESYIAFCEDMEYYISCQIEDAGYLDEVEGFPYARFVGDENHQDLNLALVHYDSFEEGKKAFQRRKKRINYQNQVLLCEMYDQEYSPKLLERFAALPGPKVLLTHRDYERTEFSKDTWKREWNDFTFPLTCYGDGEEQPHGKCMLLKDHSPYRYLDELDILTFINTGKIQKNQDFS